MAEGSKVIRAGRRGCPPYCNGGWARCSHDGWRAKQPVLDHAFLKRPVKRGQFSRHGRSMSPSASSGLPAATGAYSSPARHAALAARAACRALCITAGIDLRKALAGDQ
jgi:hypothetical protein